MKKTALKWDMVGIAFIVITGSVLHFAFEWSGEWQPLAIIAAVNESVWEHLKLGFWPAFIYGAVEFRYLKRHFTSFPIAKAVGIALIPIAIIVLFYSYTAFVEDTLAADIGVFVAAVVIGQVTSYKMLGVQSLPKWTNKFGIALIIAMAIAFGTLSYYAPHLTIFQDPITGEYGV